MLETFTPYVSNIPGDTREALLASFTEVKAMKVINKDSACYFPPISCKKIIPTRWYKGYFVELSFKW